jgi:large subunit ribosomal protein L13
MSAELILIDASNHVLGRIASIAAKKALEGRKVVIVNAEKAVITGRKRSIIEDAKRRLGTRTLASQEKAPVHPRRPDMYFRRVIRGMIPWKKPKGKTAFKNVKVFIGVPEEYAGKPLQRFSQADASKLRCRYVTIDELSREIGGKSR